MFYPRRAGDVPSLAKIATYAKRAMSQPTDQEVFNRKVE